MGMSPLRSFVFAICVGVAVWGFTTAIVKNATAEEPVQATIMVEEPAPAEPVAPKASEETEEAKVAQEFRLTIGSLVKVGTIFVGASFALMLVFAVFGSMGSPRPKTEDKDTDTQESATVQDRESVKPFLDL